MPLADPCGDFFGGSGTGHQPFMSIVVDTPLTRFEIERSALGTTGFCVERILAPTSTMARLGFDSLLILLFGQRFSFELFRKKSVALIIS